jgi:hypothetical protein
VREIFFLLAKKIILFFGAQRNFKKFEMTVCALDTHAIFFHYALSLFLSQYFGLLPAIMIADAGQRARGLYIEMSLR